MNILILSVGTRNKIIQYFRKELKGIGQVIATDCSELAPAMYEADKYYMVPKIDDKDYMNVILDICMKEHINAVISLIDPELSLIAKNKDKFEKLNIKPIISDYDIVEMCLDKYKMYEFLTQNEIKTPKSYISKSEFYKDLDNNKINFPVFIKPIKGSASININKVTSKEEVELLFSKEENLMIQEYMLGQEFGSDVYIDMLTGKIISIFIKEKIKMRAGETDKSVSIKDGELNKIIIDMVKKAGFRGVIDIDIFKVNGTYYISEVNPRFGGGYPHAYEAGVNIPKMIINNILGKENKQNIGEYKEDIYMMKYNEIKVIERRNSVR